MPLRNHLVVVDWGISVFRAWLVGPEGTILREVRSEDGVRVTQAGRFASTFSAHCGAWLGMLPDAQVVIAGAAGGRRGWLETGYVRCPADAASIRAGARTVRVSGEREAFVLPGLAGDADGAHDLMRGKECLALGAGVPDGILCVPGSNPCWVQMRDGGIAGFTTYMTGEVEALLREHSSLSRIAARDEDQTGFRLGLAAAWREDRTGDPYGAGPAILPLGTPNRPRRTGRSLLHLLQELRTAMALERMNERHFGPYLGGLLVADEVRDALAVFGEPERIHLVAEGALATRYGEALAARGVPFEVQAPATCLVRGARAIVAAGHADADKAREEPVAPALPRFVFETPFGA